VKWIVSVAAVACAIACAFVPAAAGAQEQRDPLISPTIGGEGSRFQVVGQLGWTPGEQVTVRLAFTTTPEPLAYAGPFQSENTVTVLRDGTWSFPVVVNDDLFSAPFGDVPGYIVVQAQSGGQTATNAFVFTVDGARPAGADALVDAGFGAVLPGNGFAVAAALFAAATGALLVVNGAMRRAACDAAGLLRTL
jgi:hypothetical protein